MVDLNQQAEPRHPLSHPHGTQCAKLRADPDLGSGSCRDSAWLLVNILRHLGLAARFVSGYLIQLAQDVKSLDGPSGRKPTSPTCMPGPRSIFPGPDGWAWTPPPGSLPAKGTSPWPVRRSPRVRPPSPAPWMNARWISAMSMSVRRIREAPRSTRPYPEDVWTAIVELGDRVDRPTGGGGCAPDHGRESPPLSPSTTWTASNGTPGPWGRRSSGWPRP